jgi:hypothetical protein
MKNTIKNSNNVIQNEPTNVLYRIKRGLVSYVSYLAACEMNPSFSEYLLYEPILRIFTARSYSAECEYSVNIKEKPGGDNKRVDFFVRSLVQTNLFFALEVKWAKLKHLDVKNDIEKLDWVLNNKRGSRCFLCVFGVNSIIKNLRITGLKNRERILKQKGKTRTADLGITKYSCRMYEYLDATQT